MKSLNLRPDPISEHLGTGFSKFDYAGRINGLIKLNSKGRVEILAVYATKKRSGGFRDLIEHLKAHFTTICIWHVGNPILTTCLPRYSFLPWEEDQCVQGEWDHLVGWRWDS